MKFQTPYHLKKRGDDCVSYTAIDAAGHKSDVDNICYATHINSLSDNEFILIPYRNHKETWREYFIDNPMYLKFIDLLRRHKLVSDKTEAYVEDGVPKMRIPRGTSHHRVYSAMCAYRWAESMSPFAWEVVRFVEDFPNVTIWQALHYAMAVHVSGIGHNWCNVGITDMKYGYVYMNSGQSYNMAISLAFPLFWHKTEDELKAITGRTCDAVQKVADSIGPAVLTGKARMKVPALLIDGHAKSCDVLNEKWTPLYQFAVTAGVGQWDAKQVREQLQAMYNDVLKDHNALAELRDKLENPKQNQNTWQNCGTSWKTPSRTKTPGSTISEVDSVFAPE